jgi:type VII secretion protein EccB
MPSRADQLHSYQFGVRRVVSALAAHDSNPARPPGRRAGAALLGGVLVAALGLAGFAVWGLLQPGGSTRWREGGAVIVEKESGAKYVYLDGRLHPVANYASALLISGSTKPKTVTVARRSLAGVPRGALLGIAGAPDALPAARDLVRGAWMVCSRAAGGSVLVVGAGAGGAASLLGDDALLVSTSDGSVHLVWRGRRSLVREPSVLLGILVWGPPVAVAPAFLNALPAGPVLARIAVPARGSAYSRLPGARIGQVFVVDGRQHAVALPDGLAAITPFQAALLLGDPSTVELVRQKEATPLSAGEYASLPKATLPGSWSLLPSTLPRLVSPPQGATVCAGDGSVVVGSAGSSGVSLGVRPLDGVSRPSGRASPPDSVPRPSGGASLADEIAVPPGRGAVIEAMPAPDAPSGTLHVVTDLGVRHPVPSAEVLSMLGYAGVSPVRVPAEVAALMPVGPALYPQAAREPLRG